MGWDYNLYLQMCQDLVNTALEMPNLSRWGWSLHWLSKHLSLCKVIQLQLQSDVNCNVICKVN